VGTSVRKRPGHPYDGLVSRGRDENLAATNFVVVFDRASSAIECSREVHRAVTLMVSF
jgi:hypothetical protein